MEVDRLAPTRRPAGLVIGRQRWSDLLFLHWPVPVEVVRPLVPAQLAIDEHEGLAYVGLIPFLLEDLRAVGVPKALGLTFLETNLRTYVHAGGRDPGVYFFSLDAASRFAVVAARLTFGLPYHLADIGRTHDGPVVTYSVARAVAGRPSPCLTVRYQPEEPIGSAKSGTLDHFLLERYVLHVARRGRIQSARIHHAPYPLQRVRIDAMDENLVDAADIARPAGNPPIAHYSSGVDVELFAPWTRK